MGVWAIKHQLFNEIYLGFPSKLFSKCSRQHLYVRCLYWKKSIFIILLGFWAKVSTVLLKLPFRFSQPLFEERYFSAQIVSTNSFGFWAGIFQTAGKKTRLGCENCMLHLKIKVLTRNSFFKRMFHFESKFRGRAKAFRTFSFAFFIKFFETAYYVSIAMFKLYIQFLWQRLIDPYCFLSAVKKCLVLWQKFFKQRDQNVTPCVERNFRGKDVFVGNISSYHFWSLSGNYFDVCQNTFYSPWNFSEKNFFFEISYQYCRKLNKKVRNSRTKSSPVCQFPILHLKLFSWKKNVRNCKNFAFHILSKRA